MRLLRPHLLAVVALVACGQRDEGTDPHDSDVDTDPSTETDPPADVQTFASADGKLVLEVPLGAIPDGTEVSITPVPEDEWPEDVASTYPFADLVYDLQPDGLVLGEKGTLRYTFDAAVEEPGYGKDGNFSLLLGGAWTGDGPLESVPEIHTEIDMTTGLVTAEVAIEHFSSHWVQRVTNDGAALRIDLGGAEQKIGVTWRGYGLVSNYGEETLNLEFASVGAGKLAQGGALTERPLVGEGVLELSPAPSWTCTAAGNGVQSFLLRTTPVDAELGSSVSIFREIVCTDEAYTLEELADVFGQKYCAEAWRCGYERHDTLAECVDAERAYILERGADCVFDGVVARACGTGWDAHAAKSCEEAYPEGFFSPEACFDALRYCPEPE